MWRVIALGLAIGLGSPVLSQDVEEVSPVVAAFEAMEEGDWDAAYALVAGEGAVATDLVTWMRLRDGAGDFAAAMLFLQARADWPGLDRVRLEAEQLLDTSIPQELVLSFFEDEEVQTGQGAVAYADALIAAERPEEAEAMLERLWLEQGLTEEGFNAVISAYPDIVQPHHAARADMLLWRWRTEDAARLLPHLEEGDQALVRARIGYIRKAGDLDERLALVPERLRDTPGLHYDRFNWLAARGDWTEAVALLQARSVSSEALGVPWRWGSWRRILARWQMREGEAETAYELASVHFLTPEDDSYADLEWLSGYLALTYLDDAELALEHFERFAEAVETPISLGRAGYWRARALTELGQDDAARAAYEEAAQHQTTFYGLLAAEELGLPLDPDLAGGEVFRDWQDGDLLIDDRVQAALMLLSADQRGLAVLFFADLAKDLEREEIGQLGSLLLEMEEEFFALLVAKTAVRRGILVQDIYFPLHGLAQKDLPVEPALALAIARQESEFRADAGSAVGALGLMQLMPGTAQDMARELDLPYSRGRLTSDWDYNATLGSAYLAYLRERFGESPVLIAVGYNAGPGRAYDWMSERGDPRRDGMDVVDWIEHIPFRETRNYVMRVTEGIPVYRARLSGETGAVNFRQMLIGTPPVIRPVARPDPEPAPEEEAGEVTDLTPPAPQPVRPISRPGGG